MARKTIEEKIKTLNAGHKIKIRLQGQVKRRKFFLDFVENNKREYYQLDFYLTGDPTRDDYTLRIVDEIRKKKEVELLENKTGFVLKPNEINFWDYCKKYIATKKGRAIDSYNLAVLKFSRYIKNDHLFIVDISELILRQYLDHLLTQELSPISVANYFAHIKIILRQAVKDKLLPYDPTLNIKVSKPEMMKVFLTIDEVKLLYDFDCHRPQIKNAFLFSCFTGLRMSDIFNLKWADIQDDRIHLVQKKTRQIVTIALSDTAKKILENQKQFNTSTLVFQLLETNRTRKHLKDWVEKAGITKNVSFHTARHTFATMCLTSDIDIFTVSKLLGHSDIKTTQVYAKLIDKKKDEAIKKLPEF